MKDILQPVVRKFLPYAKDKMGFDDAPSIYLRTDPENSESIFGKTAHYDPVTRVLFFMFTIDTQKTFFALYHMN
jgi:hypothetical protein